MNGRICFSAHLTAFDLGYITTMTPFAPALRGWVIPGGRGGVAQQGPSYVSLRVDCAGWPDRKRVGPRRLGRLLVRGTSARFRLRPARTDRLALLPPDQQNQRPGA